MNVTMHNVINVFIFDMGKTSDLSLWNTVNPPQQTELY